MKEQDLKTIYGKPSADFHNRVIETLNTLDDKETERIKRRKNVRLIAAIACAAALALAMTTVAVATGVFGLFGRQVGNYGLNLKVENQETTAPRPKYVKPKLNYIPENYELVHSQINFYAYFYNGDDTGDAPHFFVDIEDSNDYDETQKYVAESSETEINGNKTIICKVHEDENSDEYYYSAIEYFENYGKVVHVICQDYDEILKILEGLELEEYADYVEPTFSKIDTYTECYTEIPILQKFGQDLKIDVVSEKDDDLATLLVNVKSVEERTDSKGLEYLDFFHEANTNLHDRYFDSEQQLITPYTRTDVEHGDGINTLNKSAEVEDDRHFYLISIDVTAEDKDIEDLTDQMLSGSAVKYIDGQLVYPATGGEVQEIYIKDNEKTTSIKKGETKTLVYGVIVDDDAVDNTYITVETEEKIIDDADEMIRTERKVYLISLKEALNYE